MAVAVIKDRPSEVRSLKKISEQTRKELEAFFVSYNRLEGKKFRVLRYGGPKAARRIVEGGILEFEKKKG